MFRRDSFHQVIWSILHNLWHKHRRPGEKKLNRLTVKGLSIAEPVMVEANSEVKDSKCAVIYDRRPVSNWYKGKNNKKTKINIQNQETGILQRIKTARVPWKVYFTERRRY